MRWISRVVSVVVVGVVVVLAWVVLRANMPKTHVGQHFRAFAQFRDGSRIATGSPVMIAGVRIGEVSKLAIEGDYARVDLALVDDTNVPLDSWITKRAESAFGDDYLELIPSGGDAGAPRLKSGDQIVHVIEGGSTDTVLRSIARTMPRVDEGLDTLHSFALDGRKWTEGTMEDALIRADSWVAAGHIQSPIDAADRAMTQLEQGTTRAASAVADAKPKVAHTLDRIDDAIASARGRMKDVKQGIQDGLADARTGIDRIDPTLQQMADIVTAVNEGHGDDFKGQLGRLVNIGELADELEDGTDAIGGAAHTFNQFRSWVGFRAEWDFFTGQPNYYVTAEVQGHNDRFYSIELEKGDAGGIPVDQLHDIAQSGVFNRSTTLAEQLRFTVQFGKRFGWLQLRGGLKESEFGLGADVLLNRGALKFSVDAFSDAFFQVPDIKISAAYEVIHSIFIVGGVTDALTKPGELPIEVGNSAEPTYFNQVRYGRDYFLGANLQFTDADLMSLVRIYGAMLLGLAI
ncbi:MAG TPA: MlaD family protein [Kofleriaceae bacterium]|nr:MlaD family protein [Kofleriaceae bacterium]